MKDFVTYFKSDTSLKIISCKCLLFFSMNHKPEFNKIKIYISAVI